MLGEWGVSGDTQGLQPRRADQVHAASRTSSLFILPLGFTALEYSADEKVVEQLEGDQHLYHHVVVVVVSCWQLLFLPPAAATLCLAVTVSH